MLTLYLLLKHLYLGIVAGVWPCDTVSFLGEIFGVMPSSTIMKITQLTYMSAIWTWDLLITGRPRTILEKSQYSGNPRILRHGVY